MEEWFEGGQELTPQQQQFVEAYLEPGTTMADAARRAGCTTNPSREGHEMLQLRKVQRVLYQSLRRADITHSTLAAGLKQQLRATRGVYFQGRRVCKEVDHGVRLEAIKTGYKLYGHLQSHADGEKSGGAGPIVINLVQFTAPSNGNGHAH